MALLMPILSEHQRLISTLLGGGDQHLRLKISDEDFLSPLLPKKVRRQVSAPYNKSLKKSATSDANNFVVNVDVHQFTPEEISVKSVNDTIVIECKHEEKQDEHGSVYRHFIRKYKLPIDHDVSKCISKLSSDGVLTVTAPKVTNKKTEMEIPIIVTNQSSHLQQSLDDDKI